MLVLTLHVKKSVLESKEMGAGLGVFLSTKHASIGKVLCLFVLLYTVYSHMHDHTS